jgi:predicted lipoprotein with Yx(FWY)xxD motif
MNSLHGIRISNDLAALKNATVAYSDTTKQLYKDGEPLYWVFADRTEASTFAAKHGATVSAEQV